MSPGQSTFERTPRRPQSTASIFPSMITAALDTEYAPIGSSPITPASDETWIMDPRRSSRWGRQARA
jgi:hypothetical protein